MYQWSDIVQAYEHGLQKGREQASAPVECDSKCNEPQREDEQEAITYMVCIPFSTEDSAEQVKRRVETDFHFACCIEARN